MPVIHFNSGELYHAETLLGERERDRVSSDILIAHILTEPESSFVLHAVHLEQVCIHFILIFVSVAD